MNEPGGEGNLAGRKWRMKVRERKEEEWRNKKSREKERAGISRGEKRSGGRQREEGGSRAIVNS